MLAAQIGDRHAGLMLLQDPDDLLFRKAAALHALVLVVGQNELQTGLNPRGKVKGCKVSAIAAVGVAFQAHILGRSVDFAHYEGVDMSKGKSYGISLGRNRGRNKTQIFGEGLLCRRRRPKRKFLTKLLQGAPITPKKCETA
jgi:hypothetical protein